jgi:catechol 2,3-dioxygenase-like lactoylglutathione lyase family enzyme
VISSWVIGELAEAALHVDQVEDARGRLTAIEAAAGLAPASLVALGLRHARALLALDAEEAARHFDEGLSADLDHWPFQNPSGLLRVAQRVSAGLGRLRVLVRCGSRLESTVGTPNPVADGPRARATSPSSCARNATSVRRARSSSMTFSTVGGRSMGTAGWGPASAPHASMPSKRSGAELVDARRAASARSRSARAADILATSAISSDRLTSMDSHRPGVTNFVHIGLVVEDLDETVRFLALLGFHCGEPGVFSGEWIDRIIGLENVTVELVMARAPDGSDMFEVVRFHSPSAGAQELAPAANRPGLRHVAFTVDDVRGVVDRVREAGWETVGEIVDFQNTFLLCYVRGPEGLIVELAERLDGAPG